jgi:hypothetical protein
VAAEGAGGGVGLLLLRLPSSEAGLPAAGCAAAKAAPRAGD